MKLLAFLALLFAAISPAQAQERPAYAAGQVWEYQNRPRDPGSLLKIRQIETGPGGVPIYHISLIGVTMREYPDNPIAHLPVSRKTLDASVIRLSTSTAAFPDDVDVADGIRRWREAKGGVLTLSIALIIDVIEQSLPDDEQPAN